MGKTIIYKRATSSVKKKNHVLGKRKSIGWYIQLSFLSVAVGLILFIIGSNINDTQSLCANSKTCHSDLSMNINNNVSGLFEGQKILPPKIDIAHDIVSPSVLGTSDSSLEKHIYVDLSAQNLYAYEGKKLIFQTLISSGKWVLTPVGNFHIWEKLRATRMAGGEGADAYDLPNVPYVMYFYNDFGLHGAYWHNNFGHQMSHGCVNMRIVDAQTLYDWADGPSNNKLGTAVSVCNSFTGPNGCVQNQPIN